MITLIQQELWYLRKKIDLSNNPKKVELFAAFLENGGSLSQEELIEKVYNIAPYPRVSYRMWESAKTKMTKLISRTRLLTKKTGNHSIEWFPYDKENKTWSLYKLKD